MQWFIENVKKNHCSTFSASPWFQALWPKGIKTTELFCLSSTCASLRNNGKPSNNCEKIFNAGPTPFSENSTISLLPPPRPRRREGKTKVKRNALRNLSRRWTNAVVPYALSGSFSKPDQRLFKIDFSFRKSMTIKACRSFKFQAGTVLFQSILNEMQASNWHA